MGKSFESLVVSSYCFAFVADDYRLCTHQCKPCGGGGVRARGGDLTKESISSVGGLIEYLCSGVGTFDLFGRETGAKIKHGYLASSFLSLEWHGFRKR